MSADYPTLARSIRSCRDCGEAFELDARGWPVEFCPEHWPGYEATGPLAWLIYDSDGALVDTFVGDRGAVPFLEDDRYRVEVAGW